MTRAQKKTMVALGSLVLASAQQGDIQGVRNWMLALTEFITDVEGKGIAGGGTGNGSVEGEPELPFATGGKKKGV